MQENIRHAEFLPFISLMTDKIQVTSICTYIFKKKQRSRYLPQFFPSLTPTFHPSLPTLARTHTQKFE